MTNIVREVYNKETKTFINTTDALITGLITQEEGKRQSAPGIGVSTRQAYALLKLFTEEGPFTSRETLMEALGRHKVFQGAKHRTQIKKLLNARLIGQVENTEALTITPFGLAQLNEYTRQFVDAGITLDLDKLRGGKIRQISDEQRQAAADRFRQARKGKHKKKEDEDEDKNDEESPPQTPSLIKRRIAPIT